MAASPQLTLYFMGFVFNHLRLLVDIFYPGFTLQAEKYTLERAAVSLSPGVNSLTQENGFNPGTGEAV